MSKKPKSHQAKQAIFFERIHQIYPTLDKDALVGTPELSIRVNTLKSTATYPSPIPWAPHCYLGGEKRTITYSPAFTHGEIYLQNAASFIPPLILNPQPSETVLDMCAAPGGKASHLAAITQNHAELWVNDNSRPRLARLKANFERLGVMPHTVTLFQAHHLDKEVELEYFNKILLDAPCSGEGMMDIHDPKAFTSWSVAHIKRLASLQKQLISTAWKLLKPGGELVYSTCTIAPEENEAVVDYLLRRYEAAKLLPITIHPEGTVPALTTWRDKTYTHDLGNCLRIRPTQHLEAFFVARIGKSTSSRDNS